MEDSDFPVKKINKKKLENLERLRKKAEQKESKNRIRRKKQIAERKKNKDARASLLEKLSQHHQSKMLEIGSAADKKETTKRARKPPKKLRCVSGPAKKAKIVQKFHLETDSSSSSEDEEGNNEKGLEVVENDDEVSIEESVNQKSMDPNSFKSAQEISSAQKKNAPNKIHDKSERISSDIGDDLRTLSSIKGAHVSVQRQPQIQAQRLQLPICAEEQEIMEAINENPVVIICGEPGSGKTTQVPQFLYEAGYTSRGHLIGVTEPRRIAAISMSERVGVELDSPNTSSYQIRYETNRNDETRLLFMTDGVLIRELQADSTLSRYSVIIIDEAHERSVYTDILIGFLSRICVARAERGFPLKLIIMSATLRLEDFLQKRLFPKITPKVVEVKSRQFPVTVHFERTTPENYLVATFRTVSKIHRNLPPGGILVFVSGQREVQTLIKWLRERFSPPLRKKLHEKTRKRKRAKKSTGQNDEAEITLENDESQELRRKNIPGQAGDYLPGEELELDEDDFFGEVQEEEDERERIPEEQEEELEMQQKEPLCCLPLFSLLPTHLQQRVFQPQLRENERLCVVATNVAETSLTIPNIRYVVDAGKEKRREYDPVTGVSRFVVDWISRASVEQRSGRAGRTGPGHAYRLYSSAVFEDLRAFPQPEIRTKPIEQLFLLLKSMGFGNVANFPFPTPPDTDQLRAAEQKLLRLGALEHSPSFSAYGAKKTGGTRLTALGRSIAHLPLAPQFAKAIVLSNQHGLLPYVLTLVSALSVREPLVSVASLGTADGEQQSGEERQNKMTEMIAKRQALCAAGEARQFGDLAVLLNVVCATDYDDSDQTLEELGLRRKALREFRNLRHQLSVILRQSLQSESSSPAIENGQPNLFGDEKVGFKLQPPTQKQYRFMRHIFTQCMMGENLARKFDGRFVAGEAHAAPQKGAYKCRLLAEFVFLDPASVLAKEQPDFVLFQEVQEVFGRKCLQQVCAVERDWIPPEVAEKLAC